MNDIKDKYDYVGEFHQGIAIVVKNEKYGAILMGGYEIIAPTYDYISTFTDGYAQAIRNGECITINLSGRNCISCETQIIEIGEKYDEVGKFYNGLACVRKQDKWGVIDCKGDELVAPQFTYISDFIYGVASYKSNRNKWGFITKDGSISDDVYDDLEIDVDGNLITTRQFRSYSNKRGTNNYEYKRVRLNHSGYVIVQTDSGLIILPPYVYYAQHVSEGIICAQNKDGYWGAIATDGQQFFPFEYILLQDFQEGRSFGIDKNNKLHLLYRNGKSINILDSWSVTTDLYIHKENDREYYSANNTFKKYLYQRIVNLEKEYIVVEVPTLCRLKMDFNGKCFVCHDERIIYLPDWCLGALDYEDGICYAISKEGKWGIIDLDGKTICKPIYDKIVKREGNLIYTESNVDNDSWKHEIYGLFDIETQVAIPAEYAEYPQKNNSFYLICKYYKNFGAVDIKGNVVVKPEYSNIKWLDGYFQTFKDDKCGLVKSDGTIILQSRHYSIEIVMKGLFKVFSYKDSKVFELCNDDGIIHRWLLEIGNMNEDGNFPVVYNRRNGWVNSIGQFVIRDDNNEYIPLPDKYEWAEDFDNGVAKVWKGTYCYYVDKEFNQVLFVDKKAVSIETKIDRVIYENSERCLSFIFELEDKYGLLSKDGKLLIESKYYHLDYFSDNLYIVDAKEEYYNWGKYGIIDENENIILPFEYTDLRYEGKFIISKKTSVHQLKDEYGFLTDRYEHVDKYGLINSRRKTIFEPVFQSIIAFKKGFFVLEDNKWYIVDNKHFTKKETNYGSIERLTNNFFKFSRLGYGYYYGVLDSTGKECLAPRYKSIGEVNCYKVAVIDLDGKKGLTDEKYRILVEPQYDYVSEFKKGRATVEKRNLQGIGGIIRGEIDTKGNFFEISKLTEYDISNGKAKQLMTLSNGNIVFMKDDSNPSFKYCAVVDNANNIVLPYKYYWITELEDGSYRGLVNPQRNFCNEYINLDKNYKEVTLNSDESGILAGDISKTVIPLDTIKIKSDESMYVCEPASEGIVWIYKNNREKIGLATIDGEMLIEPCYGKVEPFVNGYAKVNNGYWHESKSNEDYSCRTKRSFIEGKWGCIDSFGKLVVPVEYDSIHIEEDLSFTVTKSILDYVSWLDAHYIQVSGHLNTDGELIIKNKKGEYILADKRFDWQEDFNAEGRSKVYSKERIGFVNENSQLIVESLIVGPEIYDLIIPKDFEWGYYCSEKVFIGLKNDKWGVFDYDGHVIIPAEYDSIVLENDKYIVHRNNKTGVISETGDTIIRIEYDSITLQDGVYLVHRDKKTGIISETGNIIIDTEFNTIITIPSVETLDNFYVCIKHSRYGLYDYEGKELLPTEYKQIQFIGHDLLAVQDIDGKFKVFDKKGKLVNDIVFDEICLFGDRNKKNYDYNESKIIENALYTIVKKDGLYGAINTLGELKLPLQYKELYCVNRNVFYGDKHYVDCIGRRIVYCGDKIIPIANDYEYAQLLENDMILVRQDGLYGCINRVGKLTIPIQYVDLTYLEGVFVAVIGEMFNYKKGVINFFNNEIIPFDSNYDDIKINKGLILCKKGRYWGAFSIWGKLICEPKYSHIIPLTEFLIKVGIDYSFWGSNSTKTHWGLINIDGEELLAIDEYDAKYTICNRLCNNGFVEYWVYEKLIGYLDITGCEVLKPTYTQIGDFIDGYAIVAKTSYDYDYEGCERKRHIYGVIDSSFQEIIPCVFNSIVYEKELGLFKTDLGYKTSDGRFIVDVEGKKLFVSSKYKYCESFHDDCAIAVQVVDNHTRYGLINKKAEDILPPIFQWLKLLDNGLYKFKLDDRYGLVNSKGKIVVPNKYYSIGKFDDGLPVVTIKIGEKYDGEVKCLFGLMDDCGNEILPPVYEYMGKKSEGVVVLMKNHLWGLYDIKTHKINIILNVNYLGINKGGLCRFNVGGIFDVETFKINGGTWGFINTDGQIVISPQYERVLGFSEGIAGVKKDGRWGFIDVNGAIIVPCEYDEVDSSFCAGKGRLVKDDEVVVFDKNGNQISSHEQENDEDNYYGGYDDTPSIYDNPYYNDNLDMDQQSIDFWNSF